MPQQQSNSNNFAGFDFGGASQNSNPANKDSSNFNMNAFGTSNNDPMF